MKNTITKKKSSVGGVWILKKKNSKETKDYIQKRMI